MTKYVSTGGQRRFIYEPSKPSPDKPSNYFYTPPDNLPPLKSLADKESSKLLLITVFIWSLLMGCVLSLVIIDKFF